MKCQEPELPYEQLNFDTATRLEFPRHSRLGDFRLEGQIADMVAAGPGVVAVGWGSAIRDGLETMTAVVWTSPDGVTWTRIPHDEAVFGGERPTGMFGVATLDGTLLAVGATLVDEGDVWTPVIWTSPDGETWSQAPLDAEDFGEAHAEWEFFGPPVGRMFAGANNLVVSPGDSAVLWVATRTDSDLGP